MADSVAATATPSAPPPKSMRKNGKNWHAPKKAFRPTSGQTSYTKRLEDRKNLAAMKEREKEMKDEKEAERQACWTRRIKAIRDRREAKEEKLRYEKMAEKMHHKRVERLRRREKRNKLLSS